MAAWPDLTSARILRRVLIASAAILRPAIKREAVVITQAVNKRPPRVPSHSENSIGYRADRRRNPTRFHTLRGWRPKPSGAGSGRLLRSCVALREGSATAARSAGQNGLDTKELRQVSRSAQRSAIPLAILENSVIVSHDFHFSRSA